MSEGNAITKAEIDQFVDILTRLVQEVDGDFQISVRDNLIYLGWGEGNEVAWLPLGIVKDVQPIIANIKTLVKECIQLLDTLDQMDDGYGPRP